MSEKDSEIPMKKRLNVNDVASQLNTETSEDRLAGVAVLKFYKTGEIDIQYTQYVGDRPAQAIGYLNRMCWELTKTMGVS